MGVGETLVPRQLINDRTGTPSTRSANQSRA